MLEHIKSKVQQFMGKLTFLEDSLVIAEKELVNLKALQLAQEEAQVLIQQVAQETQNSVSVHIEEIVQAALSSVFGEKYQFRLQFESKRGKTEANIFLEEKGIQIDPLDSTGGGVVDIVSFALRIAVWILSKKAKTILLDEPFKFLSAEYKPLMGEFLRAISDKLGLQIICVTHDSFLIEIADKYFLVDMEGKESFISKEGRYES